jgi:hypothetical protein
MFKSMDELLIPSILFLLIIMGQKKPSNEFAIGRIIDRIIDRMNLLRSLRRLRTKVKPLCFSLSYLLMYFIFYSLARSSPQES